MATSDSLIQVKNLKKHYHRGAIKALDGVTADINKGDVIWKRQNTRTEPTRSVPAVRTRP